MLHSAKDQKVLVCFGGGRGPLPRTPGVPVKREALTPQPGPGSRQRAEANLLPASHAPSKHSPAFLLLNRMKGNTGSLSPRRQKREEGWGASCRGRKRERNRETGRRRDRDQRVRARDKSGKETERERERDQERHGDGEREEKGEGKEGKERAGLAEGP